MYSEDKIMISEIINKPLSKVLNDNIIIKEDEKNIYIKFKKNIIIESDNNVIFLAKDYIVNSAKEIHLNPDVKISVDDNVDDIIKKIDDKKNEINISVEKLTHNHKHCKIKCFFKKLFNLN
ncbi:hypothetical protein F367_119 [Campylobacter phage F367]|uniref:Uncharacterized protein n=2 Tax=Fletchervirus CPX TaxID=1110702 RepID=A0A7T3KHN4_9CAUD|nr:hypothetical protein F367_119 [Campylobacter phage F367]QPX64910.1 hypothetical protein F368_119 [Campylobacter phage F368]